MARSVLHVALLVTAVLAAVLVTARAQDEHEQQGGRPDSAIAVCDSILCEMECRRKTKDCGMYGCNGVCIGYACQCFTKPRAPSGGWKEYNPLAEGYESLYGVLYDTAGGSQPVQPQAVPPLQQQQQQQQQPNPMAFMQQHQMQLQQPPMALIQQQQQLYTGPTQQQQQPIYQMQQQPPQQPSHQQQLQQQQDQQQQQQQQQQMQQLHLQLQLQLRQRAQEQLQQAQNQQKLLAQQLVQEVPQLQQKQLSQQPGQDVPEPQQLWSYDNHDHDSTALQR